MKRQIISTLAGLVILFIIGWYVDNLAHDEIVQTVRFIIYVLAYTFIIALISILILLAVFIRERVLKEQARRKILQREAEVLTIVTDTHGVFVREMNPQAIWRPLHLNPASYQNGRQDEVSSLELAAWHAFTLRHRSSAIRESMPQLLPPPAQIDLLTALDSVQRCLIVGASDTGKTTLLQHIITRRLHTSKVVVIDPHSYPDKWPGCRVMGTSRNYAEIDRALSALVQIMTKRYDEIGRGIVREGNHPKLTILIDEWRAIIANVKSASAAIKALLTESRKAAFSVFVATHSDRAKPLGLEGEYDLKDGFAIVRLTIADGKRQATIDTGSGEIQTSLPGPFMPSTPTMETDDYINLEVEPTPTEAAILNLYREGESYNEIARQVFGHIGGKQTERIKQIIAKFN